MRKQVMMSFRTSHIIAVVVVCFYAKRESVFRKCTIQRFYHDCRNGRHRTSVVFAHKSHQFFFRNFKFIMNTIAENEISEPKKIFKTRKPYIIFFYLSEGSLVRQIFWIRICIFFLQNRCINHQCRTRRRFYTIFFANIFVYGSFYPKKSTASATHSVVHIEINTIVFILNTARLIVYCFGKQVCFLVGNSFYANSSWVRNQIHTTVFINMNLF